MQLKKTLLAIAVCMSASWAADLLVQRAQMYGPNGSIDGKLVMLGDRMIFVDDTRPDMSFVIPRSDVRAARLDAGRLSIDVRSPYVSSFGPNQSTLILTMASPASAGTVVSWIGVPVTGSSGEASRMADSYPQTQVTDISFDVKNGDQRGKLILRPDMLMFESLTDARHSRRWSYAELRELKRDSNEIKIEPFHGDKYEFQFHNKAMLDTAYRALSDRIITARTHR